MVTTQSLPDGDRDRGPQMLALFWSTLPIMLAMVGLRIAVRMRMRNLGMDDYMMLAAVIVHTAGSVPFTLYLTKGGLRHLYYIDPPQVPELIRLNFISQPFGAFAAVFAKMSVALLVLRITTRDHYWRRMLIYVSTAIHLVITIVAQIVNFTQCSPTRALWTPVPGSKCWDPKVAANFTIAQSAYGTWQDLLLAVIPCTIIWSLSLSKSTKLSLCALLSLGLVAGIFSGLKTAHMGNYADRTDFTWAVYPIFMWATGENALIVIFGSIPPIKPLLDRWLKGKAIVPSGRNGSYKLHSKGVGDGSNIKTFGSSGRRRPRSEMWTSMMDTVVDESDTGRLQKNSAVDDTRILVERSYDVSSQRDLSLDREPDRVVHRV